MTKFDICNRKSYFSALLSMSNLIENSKGRSHIEIDFFGGEPMMNFDVVKETVAYGRSLEKSKRKLQTKDPSIINYDAML